LGLVGRSGVVPLRYDRDTAGPLARCVADAAALLSVMAGPNPRDNMTALLANVGAWAA
jgi:amidase